MFRFILLVAAGLLSSLSFALNEPVLDLKVERQTGIFAYETVWSGLAEETNEGPFELLVRLPDGTKVLFTIEVEALGPDETLRVSVSRQWSRNGSDWSNLLTRSAILVEGDQAVLELNGRPHLQWANFRLTLSHAE